MSRLKKFTRSVLSGYAQITVNVLYTLASVPLALHYLSKAEFGLWALSLQVTNFIALVDLGMGSSIARILIDHKDDRHNGHYGGAIKSGFLVGAAQGLVILAAGMSLVWFLSGWLRLSADLAQPFFWLIIGQVLLTALSFSTRIFNQILYAWQRIDVSNYSAIVQLVAGFIALWAGFFFGFGIFSLLVGAAASWACGVTINAQACVQLGFWPKAKEWGHISRKQFHELFNYGADVFLISIGTQLIISSQTVLISRQLGIETAALWAVMTKMFTLVSQMVWRTIGNAMPTFAEMQVRREWDRLWKRYRALFITTNVCAGICAVLFAACNSSFVTLWMLFTHRNLNFSWPSLDNALLGIWLITLTQQCCHNSLIMCLKEIRKLKYVFLLEGIVFIVVALMVLPVTGITGMLASSLAATILCTWLSGAWRIAQLSKVGWKPLLWDWQKPLILILISMIPIWLALDWVLPTGSSWLRLIVNGGVLSVAGVWVAVRYALPIDFVVEIATKLPKPLQRAILMLDRNRLRVEDANT